MLNLFQGGKVTSGLSTLRSEDSNCKGGDAAGNGMGRIGGNAGSGGDGICGNGDDNGVSGDGGGLGIAKNLAASSLSRSKLGAPPLHHHRPSPALHPPHQHHLQRAPPPSPHHHGQWDNQLDLPLDLYHHPPLVPHLDQTQECIMVTQQWVRQQQAVAAPQLKRHHPLVVYTLGTPAPVHKVCKRVRVVPALDPRGQARSLVEGLDTVVYVTVESSESDMIVSKNQK
nr:hypothetical protein [Tanacetum cinerariifolium]